MQEFVATLIRELLPELHHASCFEDAAIKALQPMLQIAARSLKKSAYRQKASLRLGMVHLRPTGSYRGLTILEYDSGKVHSSDEEVIGSSIIPSATLWDLIEKNAGAIIVDVNLGRYQAIDAGVLTDISPSMIPQKDFDSSASLQRLLKRGATHICAIPMRASGGLLCGMISLEVSCPSAMGREFIWGDCVADLQLIADLASPSLMTLPLRSPAPVEVDSLLPVVGASMAHVIDRIRIFARQEETLLLTGGTGVGKSRLAEWSHKQSPRHDKPFQVVDLLTIPEEMQMAELFGWKRGAFTGATGEGRGCVELAEGGTLFIDEIDKISLNAQAGLLQLIENKKYHPLGEPGKWRKADVRFIIATNADLKKAVAEGRFREELYYRINVLSFRLPSLNERIDELPDWVRVMLNHCHQPEKAKSNVRLGDEVAARLISYSWPGNLRQLNNVIRRAYAMAVATTPTTDIDITIRAQHIEWALESEGEGQNSNPTLMGVLRRAAEMFADEAIARHEKGQTLDIDLADGFRGLVLQAAQMRLNDLKQVYLTFGREQLVRSRNHSQSFNNESKRVDRLIEALADLHQSSKND